MKILYVIMTGVCVCVTLSIEIMLMPWFIGIKEIIMTVIMHIHLSKYTYIQRRKRAFLENCQEISCLLGSNGEIMKSDF